MRHVVWDWNGTLLDDLPLVVDAVNAVLDEAGVPRIDADGYRAHYTRPVHTFYEQLYGRPIDEAEFARLDHVFHVAYDAGIAERARLAADATDALGLVAEAGRSQSLLSMYRHAQLVPLVRRMALHGHFTHVQGLTGPGGGHKQPHLEAHLRQVADHAGNDPSRVLVVGDALDDAHAATAVGARCVLVASGSHPVVELEQAGVPVASSLLEALGLGGVT